MSRKYPEFFFGFSGSTKESVKAIGNRNSGWSSGKLIRTRLLSNLDALAADIISGRKKLPPCIYLVGGPGNGKTEAAEYFLDQLYGEGNVPKAEGGGGYLYFKKPLAEGIDGVVVVEDASVLTKEQVKNDALEFALRKNEVSAFKRFVYLCCVNRGVLAEAINFADINSPATNFLSALTDVVSCGETSSKMWPLTGNPHFTNGHFKSSIGQIYVWPMDAESLIDPHLYGGMLQQTPGYKLFESLFASVDASACEICEEKGYCPFFENIQAMKSGKGISDVITCLHAYEVVIGSKILFRDLLSVANVIFVGAEESYQVPKAERHVTATPCAWVVQNAKVLREGNEVDQLASAFKLASRRYNQMLFGDYSEFQTKDVRALVGRLRKALDVNEFKSVDRLLRAIHDMTSKHKNSTRVWEMIHMDFCRRMDVALEESIDELEKIEIGFCSSTQIGASVAKEYGAQSGTLLNVFEQLERCEEGLGNHTFDVSTERGELCRRCLQVLQVLGSRMAKREVGGLKPAVFNYDDINVYERICYDNDVEEDVLAYVRKPLGKVLSLGNQYYAHVLQSVGQTRISPKYVFAIRVDNKCQIKLEKSKSLPVSADAPVDPTPNVEIRYSYGNGETKLVRIPLTYSMFFALRKVKEGLSIASISEQTFVSLNLLSSKLLGMIMHSAEDPRFEFPDSDTKFVWLSNKLTREDAE